MQRALPKGNVYHLPTHWNFFRVKLFRFEGSPVLNAGAGSCSSSLQVDQKPMRSDPLGNTYGSTLEFSWKVFWYCSFFFAFDKLL